MRSRYENKKPARPAVPEIDWDNPPSVHVIEQWARAERARVIGETLATFFVWLGRLLGRLPRRLVMTLRQPRARSQEA